MNKKAILFTIFFTALFAVSSLNTALAAVDGTAGSADMYDSAAIIGTLTKDITDTANIFTGSYGDGQTYSLSDFSLRSGEIYDSASDDDNNGYGNITFNPAFALNDLYNSSGYLLSEWTETDPGSTLSVLTANVADVSSNPASLRLFSSSSTGTTSHAYLSKTLTASVSLDKYLLFGAYINQESLNISGSLRVELTDISGNKLNIYLQEDTTDWSIGSGADFEQLNFDDDAGDTILICSQLSEIDSWSSAIDLGSITTVTLRVVPINAWQGQFSIDIFAFDFLDSPAKAGLSRANELSTANDYIALNVTDPSSPGLKIRQIDSHISRLNDAKIDFIYSYSPDSEIYDDTDFSVTRKWEMMIDTQDDWSDEVSFSNMKLYYVLGTSASKYSKFQYAGQEKSSLLLNEEAGDAILLSDSIEIDTVYLLEVTRTYTAQYTY